jgi:hypothetical protein
VSATARRSRSLNAYGLLVRSRAITASTELGAGSVIEAPLRCCRHHERRLDCLAHAYRRLGRHQHQRRWRQGVSPVAAGSPDLALRIGRLACQDPGWTPACRSASHTRDPAALAPAIDDVRNVVAAVHYATHAVTLLATQDMRAVRTAAAGAYTCPPA